jgi:hypothetical protein
MIPTFQVKEKKQRLTRDTEDYNPKYVRNQRVADVNRKRNSWMNDATVRALLAGSNIKRRVDFQSKAGYDAWVKQHPKAAKNYKFDDTQDFDGDGLNDIYVKKVNKRGDVVFQSINGYTARPSDWAQRKSYAEWRGSDMKNNRKSMKKYYDEEVYHPQYTATGRPLISDAHKQQIQGYKDSGYAVYQPTRKSAMRMLGEELFYPIYDQIFADNPIAKKLVPKVSALAKFYSENISTPLIKQILKDPNSKDALAQTKKEGDDLVKWIKSQKGFKDAAFNRTITAINQDGAVNIVLEYLTQAFNDAQQFSTDIAENEFIRKPFTMDEQYPATIE